ncbi:MAG TPA: hybrid sensor histidine kinase/response regulator, partial [Coleofasciculaceae cyanobacterium]
FEGYECLSLALSTELTETGGSNAEVLDRATTVFAQLQGKLGDWMGESAQLPTSADLGFDVMQSMFEVGVAQRLDQMAVAIASAQSQTIATVLRTQAEVFLGLAESLDLPGFGAIARTTIAALDRHPDQVVTIARCALADFQTGQAAVLAGDRSQGGQPSRTLQQLAGLIHVESNSVLAASVELKSANLAQLEPAAPSPEAMADSQKSSGSRSILRRIWNFILDDPAASPPSLNAPPSSPSKVAETQSVEQAADLSEPALPLLESIWGGYIAPDELPELVKSEEDLKGKQPASAPHPLTSLTTSLVMVSSDLPPDQPETAIQIVPLQRQSSGLPPTPFPEKRVSRTQVVRVNVEDLKYLSYSVGELLTNQNHQILQNEQLQAEVRALVKQLKRHQQRLNQLYEYPLDSSPVPAPKPTELEKFQRETQSEDNGYLSTAIAHKNFDALELDRYNDSHLLVQSLLDDTVQLSESAEAVDLFARQASQTLTKQHLLLANAHNALIEARMLALGEILNRFPSVLQQLETLHNKQVALEIHGAEVLVDKVVAEKLYDPLLHLVRNAFDHGIEPGLIRQQRGKSEKGRLEIRAYHRSRYLTIEIRDDGEGLNFERIRQRAIERQMISSEQASRLSQSQLTDLLFEPGFSTVVEANTLSGRGIGLDVVRNQLQTLQASIAVDSEPYRGTTFTLKIPLDLAIAKLLICQIGTQPYALLTDAIEQIVVPQPEQIRQRDSGKVLRWQQDGIEQLVPVYLLSEILDYRSMAFQPAPASLQSQYMLLVRCPQGLVGLAVDQLVGEQELVIRPLGTAIACPLYLEGASILADGRLTPVIAVAELLQLKVFDPQQRRNFSPEAPPQPNGEALRVLPASQQLPIQTPIPLVTLPQSQAVSKDLDPTILIVEDSITTRQTLALSLQKAGYQVLQAKDGQEALDQLQQSPVRLVICDLEMPRMNGFEFLSHCQRDPALASLPVIILTSRSSEKHRLLASQLGATAYITKPYIEHKLLNMVYELLVGRGVGV